MAQQPSGTVTFLFSDIEGSTVLLRELGAERYARALDEHRRLLRTAFDRHHGYEVGCEGDAFFVAFQSARAAIQAAAEAQEGIASHAWPDGTELRIRIGLHTGEPLLAPPNYVGMDVHKAARIMAAGHGGQVLLSQATRDLIGEESLPLCDLGEHRFKDLAATERVFQLGEGKFPPLKTLYRSNFPVPATQFLGRERELSTIVGMINDPRTRLLTLTGPGGTGKTRLALQAAAEAADAFPDGMIWVPLAPVRDPAHTLSAVAQALEVREEPGAPLIESLTRALTERTTLLLLDNAEHLLPDVADDSAALLTACPALRLLVTSRERLQVQSETVWPVPQLAESDGERLFVERARALEPSFVPTAAVADLCRALDELPLAIELAAARCVVFSPDQLIERLGQRLDLLKGARDVDPRQQTLRATIEWSYDLLDDAERQLFARLSVFAGGCRLEAAERVCDGDPDTMQSLLDKSLVRRRTDPDGQPRYWMLETIREFAAERLGDADATWDRMIDMYGTFAENVRPGWHNGEDAVWLPHFRVELPNIRVAILEALERRPSAALAIASYLGWCWQAAGRLSECRDWVRRILSGRTEAMFDDRAWACGQLQLAIAAFEMGDEDGVALLRACLPLLAAAGFPHEHALMLAYLAWGLLGTAPDEAEELAAQAEAEAREIGNEGVADEAVGLRASLALKRGDVDAASALLDGRLAGATGFTYRRMLALLNSAEFWVGQCMTEKGHDALREAREIATTLGYPRELIDIDALSALGWLLDGDVDRAESDIARAREAAEAAGRRPVLALLTLADAGVCALRGDGEGARSNWEAAISAAEATSTEWGFVERAVVEQLLVPLAAPE